VTTVAKRKTSIPFSLLYMVVALGICAYFGPYLMTDEPPPGVLEFDNWFEHVKWRDVALTGIAAVTFRKWQTRLPKVVTLPRLVKGSWMVPVGKTKAGKWLYHDFDGNLVHVKVSGTTGYGKSAFQQLCLYVLCNQQSKNDLHVYIIDMKRGATFGYWYWVTHVKGIYYEINDAYQALCLLEDEMFRRLEQIRIAKMTFSQIPEYPKLLLVIDEGAELSPKDHIGDEKKIRQMCMQKLSSLARLGREPNVRILYGTQRPDADTLPMTIRDQMEGTYTFRVSESYTSEIVLGRGNFAASELPNVRGRLIHKTPMGNIEAQATYVDVRVINDWIRDMVPPEERLVDMVKTGGETDLPLYIEAEPNVWR